MTVNKKNINGEDDRLVGRFSSLTLSIGLLCAVCGEPGKKMCGGCKSVIYCGDNCLIRDWKKHHHQVCGKNCGGGGNSSAADLNSSGTKAKEDTADDKERILGIVNIGNTCYISSGLHALFSLPSFLQRMKSFYNMHGEGGLMPLTKAFLGVAETIGRLENDGTYTYWATTERGRGHRLALRQLRNLMAEDYPIYGVGRQCDVHEFLTRLLEMLHIEENSVVDGNELTPTNEFFLFTLGETLQCETCGVSRPVDAFSTHRILPVPVGVTVEEGLENFFSESELVECDCEIENCSGSMATKTVRLISRPKALLVLVKRFEEGEEGEEVRKIFTPLTLPENLAIASRDEPEGIFHLCGVIHHHGKTPHSGHYTACAVRRLDIDDDDDCWVHFNDLIGVRKSIQDVTNDDQNQKECYVAAYLLKNDI